MSEKEIYDTVLKAFYSIYSLDKINKKVMISHVHPSGTEIESMSKFVKGSSGLRRAVERLKPDFLFCSHVHEAQGLEEKIGNTTVFCVGKEGRILDL
jgi:Icc-related predicted phosphoesterase